MIKAITTEEFEQAAKKRKYGGGRKVSNEGIAIQALEVGQGISMPCRWRHRDKCYGISFAHQISKRKHIKLRSICRDHTLYVLRVE